LPKAEHIVRQVSRLDPKRVAKDTIAKSANASERLIETAIRQAAELSLTLRAVQAERDYVRRPAGGGSEEDRLAAGLIERLGRIWTRHTNRPVPAGASGPFVSFVAAAWRDLSLPEFTGRDGAHQPLVDAIGNRVVKFQRRHNRDENNQGLCHKPPASNRASSPRSQRR
jgi:hypothetical protein